MRLLHRLIAPPYTPMNADGGVNLGAIDLLAASLVANGVTGAFVCGTTGESLLLTLDERLKIAERWRAVAPSELKIIIHVGHNCLPEAQALAAHAQRVGADAIALMPPCFLRPQTVDDVVAWCAAVAAEAPDVPFYYYHIPEVSRVLVPMTEFLPKAAERIPNLAGAKFTYEDLMDFGQCVRMNQGFNMLYGRDQMLLPGLSMGADGAVGTCYNFAAPLFNDIIAAFDAGDFALARTKQAQANDMIAVFLKYGTLAASKAIMGMIGLECGPARLPVRPVSADERDQLRAELEEIGFFSYCSTPA
ncbi:MAG: dihydrodipicolinate synthetase [Chloroflexi bacterium]|nr:dihydrodipicolinate synthetase [Chloroflexota bacterium]